ncbi:Re/Si-specific NAD(P)(+) transhydrogenase subunit alpha [Candidatus Acetothermia bacterium]|nr:Re/Si-specific NAD(P)(+) transhydrogenase subunit alpha [Candidatus Acetothermia bacterium]MBI3460480.1 Re/Si-specific NAD(P)(+) transhydrogenase subunit alpha [Candidatus Acetothermia bacterium]
MKIAIPKEIVPNERRVSVVPETAARLVKSGLAVRVEAGAGVGANFSDQAYKNTGTTVVSDPLALYDEADVVLKVQKPVMNTALGNHEVELLREGTVLISFLQPMLNPDLVQMLAQRKITAFSMDAIPRTTRAQSMDALSSQSTVAGYKAVLLAANAAKKLFPMLTTAAGTITPAKVFILGAGVAGLQAIATAKRLGAIVQAFDVRPAVKQEVESLGAKFVGLTMQEAADKSGYAKELSEEQNRKNRELIAQYAKDADIVITTALVPGKKAPVLITKEMIHQMKTGAVIVDLAAEQGGNCEATKAGQEIADNGVTVLGPVNLPSMMSCHASQMYSKNITTLLQLMVKDGKLNLDFNDEIIKGCCITHEGKIL